MTELERIKQSIAKDFDDLTDEELTEMAEMELKAKGIKNYVASEKVKEKPQKPRNVKISDEKQALFSEILTDLEDIYDNVTVLKENKLISVEIGGKIFKIDIIEQRKPKN